MANAAPFAESSALALPALTGLATASSSPLRDVQVECDPDLRLPASELAPIKTIAGEAIAYALQHAFPEGRHGHIWIKLAEKEGRLVLTVRDDGIGMPDDLPEEPSNGFGAIQALARQLGGYARIGSAPFGGGLVSVIYPRTH